MQDSYDVIVVGARCAGSPTAMLLARRGHRVLVVDRAAFPSDTLSTHVIHPPGVAALARWGLLDRVTATGVPPIARYSYDLGAFSLAGSPRPLDGIGVAYAPRRTVLDALLVEAAAEAGAEVRERFTVDGLTFEDGRVTGIRGRDASGRDVVARASVVVGADGRSSLVARAVRAHAYVSRPPVQVGYYTYWDGLPVDGFETYLRHQRGFAAIPTNDGLTLVVAGWPYRELHAHRHDPGAEYMRTLGLEPAFAERVAAARRVARFRGGSVPNHVRRPYGPGWTLAGDAGYDRDPVTAWGISDAFRDAELTAAALDDVLAGRRPFEAAMADVQARRDAQSMPMFELTLGFASFEPPPPPLGPFLAAIAGDQREMDAFVSAMAGTLPLEDVLGPANVQRVLGAAEPLAAVG